MKQQSKVQTTQPIQQPLKMQEELQKVVPSTSQTQVPKSQVQSTVNLLANQKTTPAALQAAVMQINSNSQQNLAQSQQALLNRTLALHRQQMMQKQMVQGDRIIHNPAGIGKDIATVMKAVTGQSQVLVNATAAQAEKSKHKAAFHYSSAMTRYTETIIEYGSLASKSLNFNQTVVRTHWLTSHCKFLQSEIMSKWRTIDLRGGCGQQCFLESC